MQDVVRGTGLARQTLHDLYHDKSVQIHLDTLNKLCEFFDVGPEQIFERAPDAPPTPSAE
jgi:putative transcriptional regulator